MNLTIVGSSPATQNPASACSCYLVRHEGTSLVMDMGSGAFGQLQRYITPDEVDTIVISHTHADHVADLVPYRYWLTFNTEHTVRRPRLLLPPNGHARILALIREQDASPTFFTDVFDVAEYDPDAPLDLAPLALTFHGVHHAPHTYAIRVRGGGDGAPVVAYSADSGPCPELTDVAHEADLFICENANLEGSSFPLHLTPRQAAGYAEDGRARRLVLTHRWHLYGLDKALCEAGDVFHGPMALARDGDTYAVASLPR